MHEEALSPRASRAPAAPARVATQLLLSAGALLALVLAFVEGHWQRTVRFVGPFVAEAPGTRAYVVDLLPGRAPRWFLSTEGDTLAGPARSRLTATVDGRPLAPAHALHDDVRARGEGRLSHWRDSLVFSLPPGAVNGPEVVLEVRHLVCLAPWVRSLAQAGVAVACLLLAWDRAGQGLALARRAGGGLKRPWRWCLAVMGLAWSRAAEGLARGVSRMRQSPLPGGALVGLVFIGSGAVLTLVCLLALGAWPRTACFTGPFTAEMPGTRALVVDLAPALPRTWGLSTAGDVPAQPCRSRLLACIDGHCLVGAHAQHAEVRAIGGGRYSHWHDCLIFSLPPGVDNGPGTTLTVSFPVQVERPLWDLASVAFVASGLVLVRRRYAGGRGADGAAAAARGLGLLQRGAAGLMLLCAFVYGGTIVAGGVRGDALPTTAVFDLLPHVEALGRHEPAFPFVLLALAMAGAATSWFAAANPRISVAWLPQERRLQAFWQRWGLVIVVGAFVFSAAGTWHGLPRWQDLAQSALAGLVPFNDAKGHLSASFDVVEAGSWPSFAQRRPAAAAMRCAAQLVASYGNVRFLLVQTLALAVATWLGVRAVSAWRGIWAGLTYLALAAIAARPYLPTHLSDPLGLFWGLLAVPLLVAGLRTGSLAARVAGFAALTFALVVRQGSMFTIPATALWVAWAAAAGGRRRFTAALGVLALTLGAFAAANGALHRLYGSGEGAPASNFAYCAVGLTHGGDWQTAYPLYARELAEVQGRGEAAVSSFLYARAWDQLCARPGILLRRLAAGLWLFVSTAPDVLLGGYRFYVAFPFPTLLWQLAAAAGAAHVLWRRRERHEGAFWGLTLAGILGSAPFVIFDDGWRVLCPVFPLLGLFAAVGFASPSAVPGPAPTSAASRAALAAVGLALGACLAAPWLAHRLDPPGFRALRRVPATSEAPLALGGPSLAGFLVVPDGAPRLRAVPTVPWSWFRAIVANSGIESYEALEVPARRAPPFGVVFTPLQGDPARPCVNAVVPPEMLLRREVAAWRCFDDDGARRTYWAYFARVEPVDVPAREAP